MLLNYAVLYECPSSNLPSFSGTDSSSRMCIFNQCGLCVFKHLHCYSTTDRREVFKEDLKGIACFQVLEENPYGHARTHKNRRSAHDFRVRMNMR